MPNDVEEIEVLFVAYQQSTPEEVRKIEVRAIQRLLHLINFFFLQSAKFDCREVYSVTLTASVKISVNFSREKSSASLLSKKAFIFEI